MVAGLAGALLLCGAPVDADAAPASPPAPAGPYWTVEERPVRLRLLSPAARQTGQAIFLGATIWPEESCVFSGPAFEVRDLPAGSPRQFRARVWRRHGVQCGPVSRLVEQPLHVPTHAPGTVRFASADGGVITVQVSGKPRHRAVDDHAGKGPCRFDDDCWVTDVCVPRKDDPAGFGICGEICGAPVDCPSGRCDHARGIVGLCSDGKVGCSKRRPCEWGQVCGGRRGAGFCQWPTALSSTTRHDCRSDDDCDPGLKCFQHEGNARGRRCEMLCNSANMQCAEGHICRRGICEWLGE